MKRKNKPRCSQCGGKIGFGSKFKTKKGLMCLDCYLKYDAEQKEKGLKKTEDKEGIYSCPKCKKKLGYYDFSIGECRNCHTPIRNNDKGEKYKCPECGTINLDSDKFCHSCGFKLKEESVENDKTKEVGISEPVWLGVKIGFGMFIVLPLLIILIIIILAMLFSGC